MLKKTIKVRGAEERTSLLEFLVQKRVNFLEYLREVHSDAGALWMNTVYLNRAIIARHFGVPDACLFSSGRAPDDGAVQVRLEPAAAAAAADTSSSGGGGNATSHATGGGGAAGAPDAVSVSLKDFPASASTRAGGEWRARYLHLLAALALSLAELLMVPVSGSELAESVYGLLLELEVHYAGSATAKTLAQRNLRAFRQHLSPALSETLSVAHSPVDGGPSSSAALAAAVADPVSPLSGGVAAAAAPDGDGAGSVKFLFFSPQVIGAAAAAPSYDAVVPALCGVLLFLYRRLCDYEMVGSEACVRRVLSIDRHLQRLVFARLTKEIERVARQRTLREAFLLSPKGLMVGSAGDADAFFSEIMQTFSAAADAPRDTESAATGDPEVDSDDADDF